MDLDDGSAAGEKLNDEDDERHEEQEMDVRSENVKTNPAEKPEHQENHKNCPKHIVTPKRT